VIISLDPGAVAGRRGNRDEIGGGLVRCLTCSQPRQPTSAFGGKTEIRIGAHRQVATHHDIAVALSPFFR
jgi:hypothetical protein